MKKDIILFGMPGSGKGTQAQLLKDYMNNQYIHLSTGDVFRALMETPNAIGDLVHDRMQQWLLIDDKVTISLFDAYFFSVIEADKFMLLDWYPRSIPQLNNFLSKSYDNNRDLLGIYLELSQEVAIQRMMSRARDGETLDVIKTRLEKYYKYTHPIMQAYAAQQKLISVDASGTVEQMHQNVLQVLREHNWLE